MVLFDLTQNILKKCRFCLKKVSFNTKKSINVTK